MLIDYTFFHNETPSVRKDTSILCKGGAGVTAPTPTLDTTIIPYQQKVFKQFPAVQETGSSNGLHVTLREFD